MSPAPSGRARRASLRQCRRRIERLADPDGRYRIGCARCGASPVPVDALAFPDRKTATLAAALASAYRARLRRWDQRAPVHDLIVHEGPAPLAALDRRTTDPSTPI